MLTSLDFFYPLHDDPFTQGQITVCNVLSDIYASGVTNIDHFLVVLGISTSMNKYQRETAAVAIMSGMENKLSEANTIIAGGQTVMNPWVMTGGSVTAFASEEEDQFKLFNNRDCQPGDLIVLTKPLGTQMIINYSQYQRKASENESFKKKLSVIKDSFSFFNDEYIQSTCQKGFNSMADLNLYASYSMQTQMRKGKVRACTDVTGFGFKGHAENLLAIQNNLVDFKINKYVTYEGFVEVDSVKANPARDFKLMGGYTPESSGGLLIVMERDSAFEYLEEFKEKYGREAWIVGEVIAGNKKMIWDTDNMDIVSV
jgi:selenide,water dikinase